jgi:Tfp pilus assembly protein PilV
MKLQQILRYRKGFSLLDAVFAAGTLAVGLVAVHLSSVRSMSLIRSARSQSAASHGLQERVEQLRMANWEQITDVDWLASSAFMGKGVSTSASLPPVMEFVSLVEWPTPPDGSGAYAYVMRYGGQVYKFGDPRALETRMLRVDLGISWYGESKKWRDYQTCALIARGGVQR